jgi:hypothetical protein
MAFRLGRRSVVVMITFAAMAAQVRAEGFRVQTKIFAGDQKQPTSETTSLFLDGAVYDFLTRPQQTAVYRKSIGDKPGRFILLNDEQNVRTEISTDRLDGAMAHLRTWASRQANPFLQFAAKPDFKESFDPDNGKLVLASHLETYTVSTTPSTHTDALAEYREFLDRYSQLNTLLSAGPPPEPRLKLNDALARHKAVPLKVELTREGEDPLRAEHDFTWRLSKDDLKRIEDVRESLTTYREVKNEEFVQLMRPKGESKSAK